MSFFRRASKYSSKKANKFGAVRTGGMASKLEYAVYQILLMRERAGEIKNILQQQVVQLTDAKINYKADFSYEDMSGIKSWVEAKGYSGDVWKLKKRLWKCYGPGKLEIYEGSYKRPFLSETIIPDEKK